MASASFSQLATSRVTLTDAATTLFKFDLASNTGAGGIIFWSLFATDGTDHQRLTGISTFSAVSKAGTVTATVVNDTDNDAKAASGGSTITTTWTIAGTGGVVTVTVEPTGSLTETTYYIDYAAIMFNPENYPVLA